jgi:hypothetical protein
MRKIIAFPFIVALPLLCGCAALQRPVTDAALGAGGAYLGDQLSGGNPAAIAGGAAGGVLLGEGIQAWTSHSQKSAYTDGYTQGRGDGVKQLYWNLQDQQRTKEGSESYRLIEVTIPEHWEDGVLVKPTKRIIRIQE